MLEKCVNAVAPRPAERATGGVPPDWPCLPTGLDLPRWHHCPSAGRGADLTSRDRRPQAPQGDALASALDALGLRALWICGRRVTWVYGGGSKVRYFRQVNMFAPRLPPSFLNAHLELSTLLWRQVQGENWSPESAFDAGITLQFLWHEAVERNIYEAQQSVDHLKLLIVKSGGITPVVEKLLAQIDGSIRTLLPHP
jgi:hypothetical protein